MSTRSTVLRAIPCACLLLCSTSARAQQVINGTTETVPGTKPNPWSTGALTVGSTGTGTLNVNAGGVVNSTSSVLGSTATGKGTVNVSGAGAKWTSANSPSASLIVGNLGTGALTVRNGARVEAIGNSSVFVGQGATGTGTITVSGTGSALSVSNAFTINAGDVRTDGGGSISALTATLNRATLLVTGSGSDLSLGNNIFINNNSSVTLADGATAKSFRIWIGDQGSPGTARMTVRDGARWTMDPSLNPSTYSVLTVGRRANGELSIESGGVVSGQRTTIGGEAATGTPNVSGVVTVKGAGSQLATNEFMNVGELGSGTLSILQGGTVTSGSATIGTLATGRGTITVDGAGSSLIVGKAASALSRTFVIGNNGNANSLTISGGGLVEAYDSLTVGRQLGATGNSVTVAGAGSRLWVNGGFVVGRNGTNNAAVVREGGRLETAGSAWIGGAMGAPSTGNHVDVTGNGSAWLLGGNLSIGDSMAPLKDGAEDTPAPVPNPSASGDYLLVTNGASVTQTGGSTVVGGLGNRLDVQTGSSFTSDGRVSLGLAAGSGSNVATVTGAGSTLRADGGLTVGGAGTNNMLAVASGGKLITGSAAIGSAAGGNGNQLSIDGAASSWSLKGDLAIGTAGASGNQLLLTNGASVTQTGGSTVIGGGGNRLDVGAGSIFASDGAIAVQSGGQISLAANSRVNGGSLKMAQGSQLDVFAQENNSSLVTLSGKAELGGTLNAVIDGKSSLSYRFLVLHAGEVDGTFDKAVLDDYSASLDWMVFYTPTDVFLQLAAQIADIPGLNENQHNVADALDDYFNSGGALPPNFIPIFSLPGDQLGDALSQLSGEVGASGGAAAAASANTSFMHSMLDHAAPSCAAERPEDPRKRCEHAAWATAFGSTASLPGDDQKGSHDTTTAVAGVATGWDYARDDMRVGVALAGGGSGWNLDGNGMGSGDSTFLQLGAYGTKQMGQAYASLAGAYALQGMSTTRKVDVLAPETLTADFIANAMAGRGEAGYRFGAVSGLGLTPYAALQGQAVRLPGYDEKGSLGSGSYALSYDAATTTAVRSELGLGMDYTAEGALLSSRVAWAHDWLNDAKARAGFQSLPGTSFIVNGAEAPADLALVSLRADVDVSENTAVTARFDGEFGTGYQSYAGMLALTYSW